MEDEQIKQTRSSLKIACLVVSILFIILALFEVINLVYSLVMVFRAFVFVLDFFICIVWIVFFTAGGISGIMVFISRGPPNKRSKISSVVFGGVCILILLFYFLTCIWGVVNSFVSETLYFSWHNLPDTVKVGFPLVVYVILVVIVAIIVIACCSICCCACAGVGMMNLVFELRKVEEYGGGQSDDPFVEDIGKKPLVKDVPSSSGKVF